MAAPTAAEVERLLLKVLADLEELRIEPTPMAVVARATDLASDPALMQAVADMADDIAAIVGEMSL